MILVEEGSSPIYVSVQTIAYTYQMRNRGDRVGV